MSLAKSWLARPKLPRRSKRFAPLALIPLLCAVCKSGTGPLSGTATYAEASRYIRRAVQSSSEGVILLPSRKATTAYDTATLGALAQNLRVPLAQCFLERAVETMERGVVDGEETFVKVPEGQAKVRARLGADGVVQRAEILESGFLDVVMEECMLAQVQQQRFPPPGQANMTYIDVVYWVSLGFNPRANTREAEVQLRKEQVRAGQRAKQCLRGRSQPGRYVFAGLNLVGREGRTLVNRIDANPEMPEATACVAQALKGLQLPPERDSFVRPVVPSIVFSVTDSGEITVDDEEWLRVLELEQRAEREQLREDLAAQQAAPSSDDTAAPTTPGVSFGAASGPVAAPRPSAARETSSRGAEVPAEPTEAGDPQPGNESETAPDSPRPLELVPSRPDGS